MTRKRFVRLLMAHRYQRNEAEQIAREMQRHHGSYAAAWELEGRSKAGFHLLLGTMAGVKVTSKKVDMVMKAAAKIGAAVAAMFKPTYLMSPYVPSETSGRNDNVRI